MSAKEERDRGLVTQVSNLLYRRFPTCRPSANLTHSSPQNHHAFTRLDLLTLIVWLSALLLLGTRFLAHSRTSSSLNACQSNLQQVARAVLMYADEHDKHLPGPTTRFPGDPWWFYKEQVKKYLNLSGPSSPSDLVFACPRDRGYSDPGPFCRNPRFDFSSYVFNGVNLPRTPNIAAWPVSSLAQPARTLLVMEWTAHAPLSWHRSKTGQKNAPFYRDAESVVAFADGRVALTKIYYDGFNAAYTRDPITGYQYRYSGK